MRKRLLLAIILFAFQTAWSQESVSISIIGEYSENFNIRNYSGGIQVEVPIEDWVSVNYKATFGRSSEGAFYFHSPIGAAFGTYTASTFYQNGTAVSTGLGTLSAILFAIPEGLTFYPNPDGKIRLGIYVSPLGCDYWRKRHKYEYFKFSGEIGAKFKFPIGDEGIDFIGYGGIKYVYTKKSYQVEPLFLNAGLGVCFNFD